LEIFERERPRIVLTDIKMPGMDGIEVLRRIKAIDAQSEVIVITGHGDMDLAIRALNLDATDFINKPIQRHLLEKALEHAQERLRMATQGLRQMTLQSAERAALITVHGSLTAKYESQFQVLFKEALALNRPRIVLHFLESASLNGAGIAILTQCLMDIQREGRQVVVAGLSDNLKRVFEIVGLSRLVYMVDSVEEALAERTGPPQS
jgi:anti-anti-sigma factor